MKINTRGRIHSKNGEMDDIVIVSENGYNDVRVSYKGNICTAIFNPFVCAYYVDDKYGVIGKDTETRCTDFEEREGEK